MLKTYSTNLLVWGISNFYQTWKVTLNVAIYKDTVLWSPIYLYCHRMNFGDLHVVQKLHTHNLRSTVVFNAGLCFLFIKVYGSISFYKSSKNTWKYCYTHIMSGFAWSQLCKSKGGCTYLQAEWRIIRHPASLDSQDDWGQKFTVKREKMSVCSTSILVFCMVMSLCILHSAAPLCSSNSAYYITFHFFFWFEDLKHWCFLCT